MSWNNVKQIQIASITGTVQASGYVRVQGFTVLTSGTGGGTIEMHDLTGGTVRITERVPTATNDWIWIRLPDDGVRFENGCFVSMPAGITLGVYYG